jgi:hypothetical protein
VPGSWGGHVSLGHQPDTVGVVGAALRAHAEGDGEPAEIRPLGSHACTDSFRLQDERTERDPKGIDEVALRIVARSPPLQKCVAGEQVLGLVLRQLVLPVRDRPPARCSNAPDLPGSSATPSRDTIRCSRPRRAPLWMSASLASS